MSCRVPCRPSAGEIATSWSVGSRSASVTCPHSVLLQTVRSSASAAHDMHQMLTKLCDQSLCLREQLDAVVDAASAIAIEQNQVDNVASDDGVTEPLSIVQETYVLSSLAPKELEPAPEFDYKNFETTSCPGTSAEIIKSPRDDKQTVVKPKKSSHFSVASAVRTNTTMLRRSLREPPRRYLPLGKQFHYFLSHKKLHSTKGDACEHVARSLHDALQVAGYLGFFDIDNLEEICTDKIEHAVRGSCLMLVVMSDETVNSEWCRLEWKTACANDVEIKCIVDLQRFIKADVIASVTAHPELLKHQWVDYSDRLRRHCFLEIDDWLQDQMDCQTRIHHASLDADRVELVHPWFVLLMYAVGGSPHNATRGPLSLGNLWSVGCRGLTFVCFCLCLARLVVARGPAHRDRVSASYVVLVHVVVMHSTLLTSKLIRLTQDLLPLFGNTPGCNIVLEQQRRSTKIAGALGLVVIASASLLVISVYFPLFFDKYYTQSDSYLAFFGYPQAMLFAVVAPMTLTYSVAFLVYFHIACQIAVGVLHASFDDLDDRIAFMGMSAFAAAGKQVISPAEGDITEFKTTWIETARIFTCIQQDMSLSLFLHYCIHGWGVMLPCWFYTFYYPLKPNERFEHVVRIVFWWVFAALSYSAAVIVPFASGRAANNVKMFCRCLNFSTAQETLLFSPIMDADLTWYLGPFHFGEGLLAILMIPIIVSSLFLAHIFLSA
eukprot:TRINITY_DN5533_c0_g1_i12.p1 TRINITY_DN5533_c0_g1~~TRINITY_DN5533_c0_g1_i12.p1  ORF type:complete len:719 (+),score=71.35 TRINITY_DN5533_c0_g1_i12:94-2250(+)